MPVEQSRAKYTEELDMQPEALEYEPNATECNRMQPNARKCQVLKSCSHLSVPPCNATVNCDCKIVKLIEIQYPLVPWLNRGKNCGNVV